MVSEAELRNTALEHVERMQKALEKQPQWIYPRTFLKTPSTSFSFPDYPGLSVALRYYVIVGKIFWWISVGLAFLLLSYHIIFNGILQGNFDTAPYFFTGVVGFLWLLLTNLLLAFQFASCELVAIIVKMERHLAYISGRQKKARQDQQKQ